MARVTKVTYTLDQSIPLMAITGDPKHQYASMRPAASVTIEGLDAELDDSGLAKIREAFDYAADRCFEQVKETVDEIKKMWGRGPSDPAKINK